MKNSESVEMYLETIHVLQQKQEQVHAVDIARARGFSKPTISEWMGKLRKRGLVAVESGKITLTQEGERIAEKVYERHVAISELLRSMGVSEETAEKDACRIEHYISDETFDCLKQHLAKIQNR